MAAIPPQSFLAPPPTPGVPQGPIPTLKLSKSSLASKGRKKKTTVQIYDSNSSLAAKRAQLRTARPANLALVTKASIEELGRLTKVIDEQKALLFRYEDEIRTLKIVNMRQDKAIKKMDRDNGAVPKLIHSLNEELRIVKIERAKYLDKLTAAERIHQRYAEDISRLQHQIKDYQSKLRSKETDDMFKLKEDNNRMRKDLNSFAQQTDDLKKLLKIMENDKERDARTSRANASRHAHHIESLQQELTKLHSKLQDKEKQINTLNLYSTHAAERKHLRSRTAEEKKYNTFSEAATPDDGFRKTISFNEDQNTIQHIQKNYEDMKPVIEEKHPYTDALLQSIMNKGAAAPKPKSPEPAPRSPEPAPSSFHKPNLGYTKTEGSTESVKAGVDTVEDILARRMREQIMSQSSNS